MVIASLVRRGIKRYLWAGWTLRYWVQDKYHEQLRLVAFGLAILIAVAMMLSMHFSLVESYVLASAPEMPSHKVPVVKAFVWWVQLIIMIVAALISYAMRPKVEGAKPQKGSVPVVQDGKSVIRIYGTVWVDDSIILGWNTDEPPEPIKKKGGKK
jgi:hypothetical protein